MTSQAGTTSALDCHGLALGHGSLPVITGLDLRVRSGELVALLGPSGSGKTTLLHAVAGFVTPLAGEIWLAGQLASTPRRRTPPEDRAVGVVFQHYALWPHLSVLDIVGYPSRRAGHNRSSARCEARELLSRMQISELADRRPAELSGGEQQRVTLARALARRPAIFLFDEPTAHLDAHLRRLVLDEVARHRRVGGAAALYATHDAAEALAIADTVAVLHAGRLAQLGSPTEVYQRPVNLAVARLTGPATVLTTPARRSAPGILRVTIGGVTDTVACDGDAVSNHLLVRPDWVRVGGPFPGAVNGVRYRGPHTEYSIATTAGTVRTQVVGPPTHQVGDRVTWSLARAWPLTVRPNTVARGPFTDMLG